MIPFYCTSCGAANQAQSAFCFACGKPLQAATPSPQYPVAGAVNTTLTGLLPSHFLLKQRYRIISQIGKGGFGAVYKAEDIQFGNRLLAVKEMSQGRLSTEEFAHATAAFKGEALLLAGLKHPNLPSIYDHFSEDGRWYLVMDFIEGETLEEHLTNAKEKRLSIKEVLQIGIQLCTVLSYLHTRQPTIIFRDLKPANVIMTPEGHIYLIDFGIARLFKPGQTKDTIAFGSPGYAAPEQYGKTQSTPRSDIYSLGVTLHQLLSGNDPTQTPFQFASLQLQDQPTFPELESLIMQMLEINVNKRPDNMAVVKQELQRLAAQKSALPPSSPLLVAQASVSGVDQAAKKQLLDTSNDLYKAKRYQDALLACEQALQLDPNDASIYNLKGDMLSDLKRYEEALTAYDRAIQLDPTFALAYGNKGATLKNLKRYEEALAANERAIQFDSTLAPAYNSKGSIFLALNRYQEALAAYDRAIQLDPTLASAHGNKGVTLLHLKRYEEALATCEQAIQINPISAIIMANKGGVLFHLKRYEEALATYERAIQLDSSNAEFYNLKGVVLHDIKRYQEALALFEQALRLDPNLAIAYYHKGSCLIMHKRYEEALASLDQALRLDPTLVDAANLKAKILAVSKQLLTVREQLLAVSKQPLEEDDTITRRNHKLALVYISRGKEHSKQRRYREALNAFDTAIKLSPKDATAYNLRGEALNHLRRYEEALTTFEKAIQLDPTLAIAYSNKGYMHYTLRRYEEALAACERAIQLDPNNAAFYADKGLALYRLERYEEALAACEQALQLNPTLAIAYRHKGNVLERLGRSNEAQLAFKTARFLGNLG